MPLRALARPRQRRKNGVMSCDDSEPRHKHVEVTDTSIHVVEMGDPDAPPVMFLHGWPECWRSWQAMMTLASRNTHAVAMDLPGVGKSSGNPTDGSKREIARLVHEVLTRMGLERVTLVGQDVGGMVAYAYLRAYDDLARCVIMDVVIPGLEPWDEVLRNPNIWHFGLHAVPELPERLVKHRQADYFDFFYNAISADPAKITAEARAAYVEAYSSDEALTAGFNWYRAFRQDAVDNQKRQQECSTPLLYLRGDHESGEIDDYVTGLKDAGLTQVAHGIVPDAGHFTQEEAPEPTWGLIADFIGH